MAERRVRLDTPKEQRRPLIPTPTYDRDWVRENLYQ